MKILKTGTVICFAAILCCNFYLFVLAKICQRGRMLVLYFMVGINFVKQIIAAIL